jgi:hypothetical protein
VGRKSKLAFIATLLVALLLLGIIAALRRVAKGIAPEELRERIVTTIQSEARASLLITGSLDVTATVTIENVKRLLPGLLDIELGTSRAMVQVPGRAYYGFDVRELDRDRINIVGDTILVTVPQPRVLSVDANLQGMRVWSDKGWLRSAGSVQSAERTALQRIDGALARQAASYVASSTQPRVNSAEALKRMIEPVVTAAGIANPVYRFELAHRITIER